MSEPARQDPLPISELKRIIGEVAGQGPAQEAIERAHRRALAVIGSGPSAWPEATALPGLLADVIGELAPQLAERETVVRYVIDRSASLTTLPRVVLGREVLRAPQMLSLPPLLAINLQLTLLLALTEARAAAIYAHDAQGRMTTLASAGDHGAMPQAAQALADALIRGAAGSLHDEGELIAVAIGRWQDLPAVLLVLGEDIVSPDRRLMLEAAQPLLTIALEHQAALNRTTSGRVSAPQHGSPFEQDLVTAAERRLTRLRFDLHDGPQQDLMLLAEDMRLFRSQLEGVLGGESRATLLGRLDDLEARLIALDGDLRRISVSVQSPFLHRASFEEALAEVIEAFRVRTGVEPALALAGDFTALTDSQHITLLGLIREALSNVREHSDADQVSISVAADRGGVIASVTDNGHGFDPERTLVAAARQGHLGLVGMHERVRLLGGSTRIDSRAGGPTVISVRLPPAPAGVPRRTEP